MAKKNTEAGAPMITDVNEKIKELAANQLRLIILMMAAGKSFAEAYEVAITYPAIKE